MSDNVDDVKVGVDSSEIVETVGQVQKEHKTLQWNFKRLVFWNEKCTFV